MDIPPHETGVVRVFAIDLPEAEIRRFVEKDLSADDPAKDTDALSWPLRDALGAARLDEDFVDVIAVKDLAEVGLAGYLVDGMGLPEAAIAPDRAALDALESQVLVVVSHAFGGIAQTLDVKPPLRLVGVYRETQPKPVIGSIDSEAATERLSRRSAPVVHARSRGSIARIVVPLAIVLGAVIVIALALSFR